MRTQRRNWSIPLLAVCFVSCLVLGTVGVGVVAADESYGLTVSDAVEVPTQTIDSDELNKEHEVDAFAVRQPGESLEVAATVPDDSGYYVDLYNADQEWELGTSIQGSETVTFDGDTTAGLEPGTYSLMLDEIGGPVQAIHPVVISGYEISISYSDNVEHDGTLDVEVDVTPISGEDDPSEIEVALWNESGEHITETATGSNGDYSTSIDLEGLETGTYNLHVAALGDAEFRGNSEILGLSDQQSVEIPEHGGENGEIDSPATEDPDESEEEGPVGDDPTNGTDADPDTGDETETVSLVDEAPDSPGVQVSFENTSLRTLTFANESITGNVTVTDLSTPPADTASPSGTVLTMVNIELSDTGGHSSAVLELGVDKEAVNNSEELSVERYDPINDTWTKLETTASESTETELKIVAETPGFSLFALTETEANDPDRNPDETNSNSTTDDSDSTPIMPNETETESTPSPENQVGFGVVPTILSLLILCSIYLVRREC